MNDQDETKERVDKAIHDLPRQIGEYDHKAPGDPNLPDDKANNPKKPEPEDMAQVRDEMLEAVAAGRNLNQDQINFLMQFTDGHWHGKELAGSQSTPRGVSCSLWKKAGKERLYFNERIFSKSPRDGGLGYIDCLTGQIVADRGYNKTLAEAVSLCLDKSNRVNSYGTAIKTTEGMN